MEKSGNTLKTSFLFQQMMPLSSLCTWQLGKQQKSGQCQLEIGE